MSFAESHLGQIRAKWGKGAILYPGVFVMVLNSRDQVLLGARDDFGGWSAFGGSMELGESITDALKREILEETGVEVAEYGFFGLMSAAKHAVVYPHGDVTQQVSGLFTVRLKHDNVKIDWEHSSFGWYDVNMLPDGVTPQTLSLLAMYKEFRRTGVVQID